MVCYPYHPLAGQRILAYWTQTHHGEAHYRVVTPAGDECLLPQWMCHPAAFAATPVEQPVIAVAALQALHELVQTALSSLPNTARGGARMKPLTTPAIPG